MKIPARWADPAAGIELGELASEFRCG